MREHLKELANYVQNVSKGNPEIITLAGMPLKAVGPRRYDSLATPTDLKTESVLNGVVKVRWKKVHNAKTYAVEYCTDPMTADGWRSGAFNSGAHAFVSGLEETKRYWFRVRALGSQGIMSDWSDPAMQLVS